MQVRHLLSRTAFLGWQTELCQAAGFASMNSNNNPWQTINPWQLPRRELAPGMLGKADQDPEHLATAHPLWQIFHIIIIKYNQGKN